VLPWLIRNYCDSWRQLPHRTPTTGIGDFKEKEIRAAERKEQDKRGEEVQHSPPPKKRGPKQWIGDSADDDYLQQKVRRYIIDVSVGLDLEHLCGYVRSVLESDQRLRKYRFKNGVLLEVSRFWMQFRMSAWGLRYRKGTTAARKPY